MKNSEKTFNQCGHPEKSKFRCLPGPLSGTDVRFRYDSGALGQEQEQEQNEVCWLRCSLVDHGPSSGSKEDTYRSYFEALASKGPIHFLPGAHFCSECTLTLIDNCPHLGEPLSFHLLLLFSPISVPSVLRRARRG